MTYDWMERTGLLLGEEKLDLLRRAHVLVVGVGGGGAAAAARGVPLPQYAVNCEGFLGMPSV